MLSMHSIRNQLGQRRSWLCGLLLCVLFRAMIPAGFMAGDLHSLIVLCYGDSGSAQLLSLAASPAKSMDMSDMRQSDMAHHGGHHPVHEEAHQKHDKHHASAEHSYCLFAGVGFNATGSTQNLETALPTAPGPHALPLRNFFSTPPFRLQLSRAPPNSAHLA